MRINLIVKIILFVLTVMGLIILYDNQRHILLIP
jgi:hypothetical protein